MAKDSTKDSERTRSCDHPSGCRRVTVATHVFEGANNNMCSKHLEVFNTVLRNYLYDWKGSKDQRASARTSVSHSSDAATL